MGALEIRGVLTWRTAAPSSTYPGYQPIIRSLCLLLQCTLQGLIGLHGREQCRWATEASTLQCNNGNQCIASKPWTCHISRYLMELSFAKDLKFSVQRMTHLCLVGQPSGRWLEPPQIYQRPSERACCRLTSNGWFPSFEDNLFTSLTLWLTTSNDS